MLDFTVPFDEATRLHLHTWLIRQAAWFRRVIDHRAERIEPCCRALTDELARLEQTASCDIDGADQALSELVVTVESLLPIETRVLLLPLYERADVYLSSQDAPLRDLLAIFCDDKHEAWFYTKALVHDFCNAVWEIAPALVKVAEGSVAASSSLRLCMSCVERAESAMVDYHLFLERGRVALLAAYLDTPHYRRAVDAMYEKAKQALATFGDAQEWLRALEARKTGLTLVFDLLCQHLPWEDVANLVRADPIIERMHDQLSIPV